MTYVLVENGTVIHCVSVNDLSELRECYPNAEIIERTGNENIGWTYADGVFTEPK